VKRIIVSASAIAMLAGVLSLTRDAWSQGGNGPAKDTADNIPHKVGLIDMAYVFKNYKKFEVLREELKVKIAKSEDEAKSMQQDMVELQKKMKELTDGSPEFTKTEKELVQKAAGFEGFKRQMSREFLKEESQIYLAVYNEVSDAVKFFAEKRQYTLVMRFNKEDLENENPQQMLQNMNRQVVYHRDDDDITAKILTMLNKRFDGGAKESAPSKPAPRIADEMKETKPGKPRAK